MTKTCINLIQGPEKDSFGKMRRAMMAKGSFLYLLVSLVCLCLLQGTIGEVYANTRGGANMAITITSTAFTEGGMIPREYTCDGRDISPPLAWSGAPEGTKSLALICDDPDAPVGTWVHWVLFNIPATADELPQSILPDKILEDGARHGINDFRKFGYGGPCPPGGTHRYYFKIYALDTDLTQEPGITKAELLKAMEGRILAEGQLMGRYKR
jgi:Raf kinase inhibitor-like YbhB/YbcL family protein